jgi:hypothetical protein
MAELVAQDAQGRRGVAEASSGFRGGQTLDQKRPERLVLPVRGIGGLEKEVLVPSSFSIFQDLYLLNDITIFSPSPSTLFGENTQRGPRRTQDPVGPILIPEPCYGLWKCGRIGVRRRGFMCGKRLKPLLQKSVQ